MDHISTLGISGLGNFVLKDSNVQVTTQNMPQHKKGLKKVTCQTFQS